MSLFVSPLFAIARAHDTTVIGSVALRKDPRIFCPHRSDRCRTLMLKCRNSPLWQRCKRWNNVLSPFWLPWSNHWTACSSRDMCVNWNEAQVSRLQIYEQPSALSDDWIRAGRCKRRYPKGQSRTCYQECGCHLINSQVRILKQWYCNCNLWL